MNDFAKYKDLELCFLMRSDNREIRKKAFDEIYKRHSAAIYTFCFRFLRNKELAKDTFQEVFVKFYDYIQVKNDGVENLGGYLLKIARNECLNLKSNSKQKKVDIDEIEIKYNDDSFEKQQNRELLLDALNRLPAKYRELLILKEFLNYTYNEIADITEQSRGNVGIMIHRAKQMLKDIVLKIHKITKIEIED